MTNVPNDNGLGVPKLFNGSTDSINYDRQIGKAFFHRNIIRTQGPYLISPVDHHAA